jgi:hypothetical protein
MRKFDDQPVQAFILNSAHWGFTLLINASLGVGHFDKLEHLDGAGAAGCARLSGHEPHQLELDDGTWVLSISGVRHPSLFEKPLTRLVRLRGGAQPRDTIDIDLALGRRVARVIRPESPP